MKRLAVEHTLLTYKGLGESACSYRVSVKIGTVLPKANIFLFRDTFSLETYLKRYFLARCIFSLEKSLYRHFLFREFSLDTFSLQRHILSRDISAEMLSL